MTIVMKFGGTSVGSSGSLKNVLDIVKSSLDRNPVIVVSAISGITDMLIKAAKDAEANNPDSKAIEDRYISIIKELGIQEGLLDEEFRQLRKALAQVVEEGMNKRMLDLITSFGERMSSKLVAAYLNQQGIKARHLFAYDIGFVTDSNFTEAELDCSTYDCLKKNQELNEKGIVNVVTGFIAKDRRGDVTTLGRGGSDYSAAILGAAIDAEEVQIWTDVDGIMTSDPKIVPNAMSIDEISFTEAAELAYFGAKVIHPKTMMPAMDKDIPVVVMNTHNPGHKGTVILKHCKDKVIFKAVSSKKNITVIRIVSSRMLGSHGFLAKIFEIFDRHCVIVDAVSTSEVSVSVTVDSKQNLNYVIEDLEKIGKVDIRKKRAIICVIGKGMENKPGMAGRIINVFGKEGINIEMISQGASQVNNSVVIQENDANKAVIALHRDLIETEANIIVE